MKVFIDAITPIWTIIIFDWNKIVHQKMIEVLWNEFSSFLDVFLSFMNEYNQKIEELEGLSIINWPWWFTWTRIISLIANTIWFVNNVRLEWIDYFTLLDESSFSYPMIIKANRSEYLLKENKDSKPFLISKEKLSPGIYSGIWDDKDFEDKNISIKRISDYNAFISNHSFGFTFDRIEPYYIKKPNIT